MQCFWAPHEADDHQLTHIPALSRRRRLLNLRDASMTTPEVWALGA